MNLRDECVSDKTDLLMEYADFGIQTGCICIPRLCRKLGAWTRMHPKFCMWPLAACMLKFVTTPRHHVGPESEGPAPAKSRLSNHQMYQSVNATSRAFCRDMFRCQTAAAEAGCLKVYYSGLNNYQYYSGGSVLESQYNISQNPILF